MPLAIIQSKAESCRCQTCGTHLVADEWNDILCPMGCDEEENSGYHLVEDDE